MSENYCISCGSEIPEGRMICYACEKTNGKWHLDDGTVKCISKDISDSMNEIGRKKKCKRGKKK